MVLDIVEQRRPLSALSDGSSVTSETMLILCIRQAEKNRSSQKWRLDIEGRLVNEYYGKTIWPQQLSPNSIVMLQSINSQRFNTAFKLHQFQLKPGSGKLVTSMKFQGPTRVLIIEDREKTPGRPITHLNGNITKPSYFSKFKILLKFV